MATRYERVTIAKGETSSSRINMGPRERLIGLLVAGDTPDAVNVGMDIRPQIDGEGWHPLHDGLTGKRSIVPATVGAFMIIADFGHPLSDIGDDRVRFCLLDAKGKAIEQTEERHFVVCLKIGE